MGYTKQQMLGEADRNTHINVLEGICNSNDFENLTQWERDFVRTMLGKLRLNPSLDLSAKELSKIEEISIISDFHEACSKPD